MNTGLPLFEAGPEPEGPYRVAGLRAHGDEQRGDWLLLWAEAPLPLYGLQDREAVMRERGIDPEHYDLKRPAPINELADGHHRTWWLCWPKHLPPPTA